MKLTKTLLKRMIKEEVDDEYGGGAYIHDAPFGPRAHAPRTGETVMVADEILRLSSEGGMDPHEYLVSLGFSEEGASNLLGMANLFDYAKGGMTFREGSELKQIVQKELEAVLSEVELEEKKDDDWIQKAVDPEHEGYCTPMTKETCTPKRKALAKRFKKAAKKKEKKGGTGWQGKV